MPIRAAAKGRVERAHLTLQDRLVKELRLEGISSIEAANAFMPRFIDDYNERFAKVPRNSHNAHRAVRADENLDSDLQPARDSARSSKASHCTTSASSTC